MYCTWIIYSKVSSRARVLILERKQMIWSEQGVWLWLSVIHMPFNSKTLYSEDEFYLTRRVSESNFLSIWGLPIKGNDHWLNLCFCMKLTGNTDVEALSKTDFSNLVIWVLNKIEIVTKSWITCNALTDLGWLWLQTWMLPAGKLCWWTNYEA